MVNLETGRTWKVNRVGSAVCRGIERGRDIRSIANDVAGQYGVDAALVTRDIEALVTELRKEGLVEPHVGG